MMALFEFNEIFARVLILLVSLSRTKEKRHTTKETTGKQRLKVWWDLWNIDHEWCFNLENSRGSGPVFYISFVFCMNFWRNSFLFMSWQTIRN